MLEPVGAGTKRTRSSPERHYRSADGRGYMHESRIGTYGDRGFRHDADRLSERRLSGEVDDATQLLSLSLLCQRYVLLTAQKHGIQAVAALDLAGAGRYLGREPSFAFPATANE